MWNRCRSFWEPFQYKDIISRVIKIRWFQGLPSLIMGISIPQKMVIILRQGPDYDKVCPHNSTANTHHSPNSLWVRVRYGMSM